MSINSINKKNNKNLKYEYELCNFNENNDENCDSKYLDLVDKVKYKQNKMNNVFQDLEMIEKKQKMKQEKIYRQRAEIKTRIAFTENEKFD